MNLASLIIGICFLALFIGPLVYAQSNQRRKNKQLQKDFLGLATNRNTSISTFDLWNNFNIIGIDSDSGILLYVKKQQDDEIEVQIDLAQIEKCRIEKVKNPGKAGNEVTDIRRLDLVFTYWDKEIPEKAIGFFNSDYNLSMNGELPLAEKWLGIINSNLKKKGIKNC